MFSFLDNFDWPEPELLPEAIRPVTVQNGVKWIHDYQEACVDKILKWIRGDTMSNPVMERFMNSQPGGNQSSYLKFTS